MKFLARIAGARGRAGYNLIAKSWARFTHSHATVSRSFWEQPEGETFKNNIILIGSPGSGKTSVGQLLSYRLGRPVIDIYDDVLQPRWGATIADKLNEMKPAEVVQDEGEAINSTRPIGSIVSLTGSSPLNAKAMSDMAMTGTVIYLDVEKSKAAEVLAEMKVERILGWRPGLDLSDVINYRESLYEKFHDIRIMCEQNEATWSVVDKILAGLYAVRNYSTDFISTREDHRNTDIVSFNEAIFNKLPGHGGVFIPENMPKFSRGELNRLVPMSFQERAAVILERWIHPRQIRPSVLSTYVRNAYDEKAFGSPDICPITRLDDQIFVSELFHGPTASYNDLAMQLLPQFFKHAILQKPCGQRQILFAAAPADFASALIDGFTRHADDSGIGVVMLYPASESPFIPPDRPSPVMRALPVDADMDTCMSIVHKISSDSQLTNKLALKHDCSIRSLDCSNWGCVLPKVVYHACAYLDLVRAGVISMGEEVDYCVPIINDFENMLSAYYAKHMGLPIGDLICASPDNNVIANFLTSGVYNVKHLQHTSWCPSDDVRLSNLERYLWHRSETKDEEVRTHLAEVDLTSMFSVSNKMLEKMRGDFKVVSCSEATIAQTVQDTLRTTGYLLDASASVAKAVADRLKRNDRPIVITATEHYSKSASQVARFPDLVARPNPHWRYRPDIQGSGCLNDAVCEPSTSEIISHLHDVVHCLT